MLKAQAETLSLIVIFLSEFLIRTESIPIDLQDAMKKATSLEAFMELLNASDAPLRPQKLPNNVDEMPLTIANELCKPIEVMVEVPQPRKRRALVYPVYVKLFRCRGGCDNEPRLSHCIAKEKQKIPIKVAYVSWRKGDNNVSAWKKKVEIADLHNETRCGCSCKKVRYCNPRTHIWNKKTCRCECRWRKGSCRAPYVWNNYSCKCECPKTKQVCHGHGKVWDQKQCQCKCHNTMSCSPGYYINPATCRCTCHRNLCQIILPLIKSKKHFDKDTIELAISAALQES